MNPKDYSYSAYANLMYGEIIVKVYDDQPEEKDMALTDAYLEYHNSALNSHKFYKVQEQKDGTFLVTWGRIGTNGQSIIYDLAKTQKKLLEKLKEGYKEV